MEASNFDFAPPSSFSQTLVFVPKLDQFTEDNVRACIGFLYFYIYIIYRILLLLPIPICNKEVKDRKTRGPSSKLCHTTTSNLDIFFPPSHKVFLKFSTLN